MSWILFAIMGALGALIGDMLKDGYLELPKVKNSKFYPGFLGGLIVGACVGYLVDKTALTSFAFGYIGKQAVDFLVKKVLPE